MTPGLRVEVLGHFRLTYDGQPAAGIHSRQQALLTYLMLNRHRSYSRHQIACLFWPDSTDGQALTNLRRELHELRRSLPEADRFLLLEQGTLRWRDEAALSCDLFDFEAAIDRGTVDGLQDGVRLYEGDLLPDCYEEWIFPDRERLRTRLANSLRRLTALLEERRAFSEAIQYAQRLLTLEPLDEATHRALMRLHALRGDRTAALHVYRACASVLASELGVEPDDTTRAAYRRLLKAEAPVQQNLSRTSTPPLVGRHAERLRVLQAWQASEQGRAQLVLIRGEAGIGKTRLAEELAEWCVQQGIAAARTRSYAAEGRLAYAPVIDWLRSDALRPALAQLETPWLVEAARLLPELAVDHPDLRQPEPLTETWQRQRLFEAIARVFTRPAQPRLLVLDDLQWCDRDTLEWLHYLLRADPDARLLVVGTLRTEEAGDNLALSETLLHLRQLERLVEIDLGPLDQTDTAALAAHVAGRDLDAQTAARLFRQTEGLPLFVVEIARVGPDGPPTLSSKVQAVIASRLGRLSEPARELVRLAATIGRDFSFDVLREASDLEEKTLVKVLDELWQRRVVREHGPHGYDFSHDRLREVAYAQIPPATRWLLHKRVAQALELLHASDLDRVSAQLAAHYDEAGLTAKAISSYRRAAEVARRVFASDEAIRALERALVLLRDLPETSERDREELSLQLALSSPLFAARGWTAPVLEATLARAKDLAERIGEPEAVIQSLAGLYGVHIVRGNIRRSLQLAEESLRRAEGHARILPASHLNVAGTTYMLGDLARASEHFEQAIALYKPHQTPSLLYGLDVLVFSSAWGAHALWLLGYPDRAVQRAERAVAWAEELEHPHSQALAHAYAALLHQYRDEPAASQTHAGIAAELCARYGFAYYGEWRTILEGWALARTRPEEAAARIREGIEVLRTLGAGVRRPYYLSLLAQALALSSQLDGSRGVLDAALATAAERSELWWSAELHRLEGTLAETPEPWFAQALQVAQGQGSRSLELRAAMSLARLWKDRGEPARARALLAPVYDWFTEGFETPDLVDARHLLAEL